MEIKAVEQIVINALHRASIAHDNLGAEGLKEVQKNQHGETALLCDITCEEVVLQTFREANFPIRFVTEEHGIVDIGNPEYTGVLDGLDGSSVYKKERGTGRYGTMLAVFAGINPTYDDYLVGGIIEHATKRMLTAAKEQGIKVRIKHFEKPVYASAAMHLDKNTRIYVDDYFEINRKLAEKLKGYSVRPVRASCAGYADVASGDADLLIECTRKNNLEMAASYGLVKEAGGVMVDGNGEDLGSKRYLEFGQKEQIVVVTAATRQLAEEFLACVKD